MTGIHPRLVVFERASEGEPVHIGRDDWACNECHAPVDVARIHLITGQLPCGHDLGCPPAGFAVNVNRWTARYLMADQLVSTLGAGAWGRTA